jgi:hypothetical protein
MGSRYGSFDRSAFAICDYLGIDPHFWNQKEEYKKQKKETKPSLVNNEAPT